MSIPQYMMNDDQRAMMQKDALDKRSNRTLLLVTALIMATVAGTVVHSNNCARDIALGAPAASAEAMYLMEAESGRND